MRNTRRRQGGVDFTLGLGVPIIAITLLAIRAPMHVFSRMMDTSMKEESL
jgi:hypothetical protein